MCLTSLQAWRGISSLSWGSTVPHTATSSGVYSMRGMGSPLQAQHTAQPVSKISPEIMHCWPYSHPVLAGQIADVSTPLLVEGI